MKVKVKNSKFGFMYCLENDKGFTYFPDNVTTIEQMKKYFVAGGHTSVKGFFNEPDIVYCNQQGKESKIYSIVEGKTFAGQKYAIVDHDEQKKFLFDNIVPDGDKLDFLKNHSSRLQDQEAARLTSDEERIKYYLNNCKEETKVQFKEFIDSALTSDVLKQQCEENAKGYNLPAEVIFIE